MSKARDRRKPEAGKGVEAPARPARAPWWRWPAVAPPSGGLLRGAAEAASLALLIILASQRWWNGEPPLADDIQQVVVMESKYVARLLAQGVLPWWDHMNGMMLDIPYARTVPLSAWYAGLLSMPWGAAVGVKLAVLGLLMIGAWGMRRFILQLTGSRFAAWAGGLVYVFNRFSLFEHVAAGHFDMTVSYAVFPWALAALDRALSTRDLRWGVIAGTAGGSLVLLDLQFGGMEWVVAGLFVLARVAGAGSAEERRGMAKAVGVAGVAALAASAYFLATLAELKPHLAFTKYTGNWLAGLSTTWGDALLHWAPVWEGPGGWVARFSPSFSVNWLSAWHWLFIAAAWAWARDARVVFATVVYAVGAGMAMGMSGPFAPVYEHVPFFKMFRAAVRFYNVSVIGLAVLIPLGASAIKARLASHLADGAKTVIAGVALVLLTWGIVNGPKAWEPFMSGGMYPGGEDLYQWMRAHPRPVAASQYPFNFSENRSTRWGAYQHEHRDPLGVAQNMDPRYSALAYRLANTELAPEALGKFFALANLGYLIPRGGEAEEWLKRVPGMTLAVRGEGGRTVYASDPLPLLRVVPRVVGLAGREAGAAALLWLHEPAFKPEETAVFAAETDREEANYRAFAGGERMTILAGPPRWLRVRGPEPASAMRGGPAGARLTVAGPAGAWNGWRRGRVDLDTEATPLFKLKARGSPNARLQLHFLYVDGRTSTTDWMPLPEALQPLGLSFEKEGGAVIHGLVLALQTADGREAWAEVAEIRAASKDGATSRLIEDFREPVGWGAWPGLPPLEGRATLVEDRSRPKEGRYACTVENGGAGMRSAVVIAERWYPNWRAWVDGREVPVFRAYGAFLGVPVREAGRHVVEVRYHKTPVQRVGWAFTVLSGLAALGCAVWLRWPKPAAPPAIS